MEEFSFWQEVAKQAIASTFAALVLVAGAWVTFFRSMGENRRKHVQELEAELEKQRADRRETYVTETLVTAYRDLHSLLDRDRPFWVGYNNLSEYQLKAEDAVRDIQLLGDRESAEMAQQLGGHPELFQDGEFIQKFFSTLRKSLRDRLDLNPVSGPPSFVRFLDDDAVLASSDDELLPHGEHLIVYKRNLQKARGIQVEPLPQSLVEKFSEANLTHGL